MVEITYFKSSIGELVIGSYQEQLVLCDWRYRKQRILIDERIKKYTQSDFIEQENHLNDLCIEQLQAYFKGNLHYFDIPLLLVGTAFQQLVWEELIKVPYGTTISYLNLAKKMHNEKAVRAVASANGANSIAIIIPCHRIIGSNMQLVGYAGGLTAKSKLLQLEGTSNQLELFR